LLLLVAFATLAGVRSEVQGGTPANPEIEKSAMALLERWAKGLAQAQRFSVTVDTSYDVVQDSGEKIEFGETRTMLMRRPDHLRIDTVTRDGSQRGFIFDGKEIIVFDLEDKVYATVTHPGSTEEAIDYFINQLGMRMPFSDLLSRQLPTTLSTIVQAVQSVGPEELAGERCEHIAVRGARTDWQVWLTHGDSPQLRRLVITYRRSEGQPQFRAQFHPWNFAPEVPDARFVFQPAPDLVKIPFARRQAAETSGQEKKGGPR
jgi:hypothetical protein